MVQKTQTGDEALMKAKKTESKMLKSFIAIIVLLVMLTATTFALVYATISVEENIFRTGRVQINLNNGEPVIREDEFLFEPGMTVKKDFFIENLSTWDVYYRLYFDGVKGALSDYVNISIKDGDETLYSGSITELSRENSIAVKDPLLVMEKKYLTVYFHFDENSGNAAQAVNLEFDLYADAVQTKNNPSRAFN